MKEISFNEIKKLFNKDDWDIGYLTHNELKQLSNFPIKQADTVQISNIEYLYYTKEQLTGLVFIKHTIDYDYTLLEYITKHLIENIPNIILNDNIITNLKKSAILSGLGQYGKNQLIYSYKFGFDIHIQMIITPNKIIDLPQRNKPNYNYLPQCEGCLDCFNVCPVGAIHNESEPAWIDYNACDDFCAFGNNKNIPSMKWKWGKEISDIPYSNELLKIIDTKQQCFNITGSYCFPIIEGNSYIKYPICRECCSQKKCSKYNGEYPYDKRYTLQ